MRKFVLALSIYVLGCTSLFADRGVVVVPLPCTSDPWPSSSNCEIDLGYRRDELHWEIAGARTRHDDDKTTYFPNIYSELEWKELNIAMITGTFCYVSDCNYAVKVTGDYGQIYSGKNIDSDYAGNNRTRQWSESVNEAGRGYVCDLSGAVGYRTTSTGDRCVVTPLFGYSYESQNLHMYDGDQTLCFDQAAAFLDVFIPCATGTGPYPGLNSTYTARWFGPWIGMDFGVRVEHCAYLFGGLEWHLASYRGTGKWNLREDLGPFHHKAHGYGWLATLGGRWEVWRDWDIGIIGHYRNFRTHHGQERFILHTLEFGTIQGTTRFNHAAWISWDISFLFAWRF